MILRIIFCEEAQKMYTSLSLEDNAHCDLVRVAIKKGYEVVPEPYCLKFRNYGI